MKLNELKSLLEANPSLLPRFVLPDGDQIPAHFHITEVGHVTKRFIDCGGKLHETIHTSLLQTHVGNDVEHRLTAATFAKILELGQKILPHDDIEVEVEYEDCALTQSPITRAIVGSEYVELQLGEKHTDCLASRRRESDGECCSPPMTAGAVAGCC